MDWLKSVGRMHLAKVALAWVAAAYALFGMPGPARAHKDGEPAPVRPIIPMVHSKWLVKDGAPPNIRAMTQTPDGWMWIASSAGLFRFDGVTFSHYEPSAGVSLPTNIQGLGVLNDGTLYIAPAFGSALYFLRSNALQVFDSKHNGLPPQYIPRVAQDSDGKIWLASVKGFFWLDKEKNTWHNACREAGAPPHCLSFESVFVDTRGTLWLKSSSGVFARARSASAFERVADATPGYGTFREAPDGSVWLADAGQPLRRVYATHPLPGHALLLNYPGGIYVSDMLIDRKGNFWVPTSAGILKADLHRATPQLQGYTRQHGMSGDSVVTGMEDREGNVWIATESGLDQFRPTRVAELPLPSPESEGRALVAGPGGELWIDRFHLRSADAAPSDFLPKPEAGAFIGALYRDPEGVIWEGRTDGLWRNEGGRRTRIPLPGELGKVRQFLITSMLMDADGGLWVAFGPKGAWHFKDGAWRGIPDLAGFPTTTIVGANRTLWFGSLGSIAIVENGRVRKLGSREGLDLGAVFQIVPHGAGVYLGGENGIGYFDGQRVRRIRGDDGEVFPAASGLVFTADGAMWANTGRGLISISSLELARAAIGPAYRVHYQRFDENDGLTGTAPPLLPIPSMILSSTGELVISTTSRVFHFDPKRHSTNTVVPPVHIMAIGDGKAVRQPAANLILASSPDTVRIDYTALSLALPQRVRFRYRLDGVDKDWQDAGTRRSVFYTQLAPGRYTFRVTAANDDGLWNKEGATLAFEVPPTLTQTIWFKLFCAVVLALLAWSAHRLRLRSALRRLGATFETRVAERERIARDLHDTLLQSVQGLLLVFESIARRTPDAEPTKQMMNDALAVAVQVVEEGRDKVQVLRHVPGEDADLGAAFQAHARNLSAVHSAAFALVQEGRVRDLRPAVYEELLAVGREAIHNAFVHGDATRIDAVLAYGDKTLELTVRDDGRGIAPAYHHGRPRHWGIAGIRERIAQLGATCELSSTEGEGTAWRFQVAAAIAYLPDAGHAFEPDNLVRPGCGFPDADPNRFRSPTTSRRRQPARCR